MGSILPFTTQPQDETISTPSTPSGTTNGTVGTSYTYSTGEATSSLGHSVEYKFDWGDGQPSSWSLSTSASHYWYSSGTYVVKAQARCANHTDKVSSESGGLSVAIGQIETVSTPSTPSGTTNGMVGTSYTYSTGGANSSLGHPVEYKFDWGDGQSSSWSSSTSASHSWSSSGTYVVKAQARCTTHTDMVSSESSGFSVTIGQTETVSTPSTPSGQASGTVGTSYTYSTGGATSSLGHPVEYRFNWGDGTYSDWSSSATASKSWSSSGTYVVRALSRCATHIGTVSNESSGLSVVQSEKPSPTPTPTPTPSNIFTIQPGPEGKDTCYGTVYVTNGDPNAGSLYAGGWGDWYYDFFEFDLTGSPSAADTVSATLYLYGSAPNDPVFQLNRITQSWTESGVTLANNPASVFYKNFGSFAVGTDAWSLVDITDLYKDWKNGTYPNFGVKLVPTRNNHTNGWIASSDNTTSDIRPKIKLVYSSTIPTPTPTPTTTRIIRLEGDLNFGEVQVGSSAQRTMTIYNDGNSTLTVSSISYPTGFSGNWNGTIGAGSSQQVPVTFAPTEAKDYSGNITVNSDKTSGTNTRPVSGTGTITSICTLTVASSHPNSGVSITVSPNDNNGLGNGTTPFSRSYNNNTSVKLTAPLTAGGNSFQKWQRNGVDSETSQTANVTMDANYTMMAVYATFPTPTPTTTPTPGAGQINNRLEVYTTRC